MQKHDKRVAKFMPRYDGPYTITRAFPESSVYELELPNHPHKFPKFHVSELHPFRANNPDLFPGREHTRPGPIVTEDGVEEWHIERILDQRRRGRGSQFLVKWAGYPDSDATWLPSRSLEECTALDEWFQAHPPAGPAPIRRRSS